MGSPQPSLRVCASPTNLASHYAAMRVDYGHPLHPHRVGCKLELSLWGLTMEVAGIRARYTRLDRLSRGLAKEVVLIKDGDDPMLYVERRDYLSALQDALAGVESARVVLAKALHRLDAQEVA
jgi:hypothetical protein